ncbi:TetR/AcrR family transcriptional regulator [Aquipseudomonas alcaligenes]|uniref:TetR/AcrR family transcriptional regulator n=1 Tax=Pseudomonas solani TaxID=2731552 RepID=UPI003D6B66F2
MPRKKSLSDATTTQPSVREPLTRERIETEALRLIELDGLEAFSTRRLGTALGCEAMSIYNYFPSKAHILDALVDRVLATVEFPPRGEAPAHRLRALAVQWRQLARRHARLYAWLALHRWNSRTGVTFLGEILDCFKAAGLDDEAAARGFRALGYYLLGATLDEISGYAEGTSSLRPIGDEELAQDFPLVAQAGEYFKPEHFDRTFELGLDVLLVGLGIE